MTATPLHKGTPMAKLRHIALSVTDPEAAATFFEQAFARRVPQRQAHAQAHKVGIHINRPDLAHGLFGAFCHHHIR